MLQGRQQAGAHCPCQNADGGGSACAGYPRSPGQEFARSKHGLPNTISEESDEINKLDYLQKPVVSGYGENSKDPLIRIRKEGSDSLRYSMKEDVERARVLFGYRPKGTAV